MSGNFIELKDQLLNDYPPEYSFYLDMGYGSFCIKTNSKDLLDCLLHYFRGFCSDQGSAEDPGIVALETPDTPLEIDFVDWEREGGKVGKKDSYFDTEGGRFCRKVRTGMQYLINPETRIVFGQALKNYNQVVNFINSQQIALLLHQGYQLTHAAALWYQERGIAISAVSGGGKSTMMLHLMNQGAVFCSNDRLLIRKEKSSKTGMVGIPKLPRVNPGTLLNNPKLQSILPIERQEELETWPKERLWALEEKYDVDVRDIYGEDKYQLYGNLDMYFLLNWRFDSTDETSFRQIDLKDESDLMPVLMKGPGPFYLDSNGQGLRRFIQPDPKPYLQELEGLPIYLFEGRTDFDFALKKINELLNMS